MKLILKKWWLIIVDFQRNSNLQKVTFIYSWYLVIIHLCKFQIKFENISKKNQYLLRKKLYWITYLLYLKHYAFKLCRAICKAPSLVLFPPMNPLACTNTHPDIPLILLNSSSLKPLHSSFNDNLQIFRCKKHKQKTN